MDRSTLTEGNQERLDNLAELKQSVYEYETTCGEESTLEDYLAHVALFTNSDSEEKKDRVKLMTVHSAKGLEFPFVFICELNEGVFPSRKVRTQPGMEEERRLAYVALTRAENGLDLTGDALFLCDGPEDAGLPPFPAPAKELVVTGPRIGVDYAEEARDFPWRFRLEEA